MIDFLYTVLKINLLLKMVQKMQIKRFQKFLDLLQLLKSNCKGSDCHKRFHSYVGYLNDETIKFLAECVRNALAPSTFKFLKPRRKKVLVSKIKPYKNEIYKVIRPTITSKHRRIILQKGGAWFLPILTSVVAPLVTSLINSIRKKRE